MIVFDNPSARPKMLTRKSIRIQSVNVLKELDPGKLKVSLNKKGVDFARNCLEPLWDVDDKVKTTTTTMTTTTTTTATVMASATSSIRPQGIIIWPYFRLLSNFQPPVAGTIFIRPS